MKITEGFHRGNIPPMFHVSITPTNEEIYALSGVASLSEYDVVWSILYTSHYKPMQCCGAASVYGITEEVSHCPWTPLVESLFPNYRRPVVGVTQRNWKAYYDRFVHLIDQPLCFNVNKALGQEHVTRGTLLRYLITTIAYNVLYTASHTKHKSMIVGAGNQQCSIHAVFSALNELLSQEGGVVAATRNPSQYCSLNKVLRGNTTHTEWTKNYNGGRKVAVFTSTLPVYDSLKDDTNNSVPEPVEEIERISTVLTNKPDAHYKSRSGTAGTYDSALKEVGGIEWL